MAASSTGFLPPRSACSANRNCRALSSVPNIRKNQYPGRCQPYQPIAFFRAERPTFLSPAQGRLGHEGGVKRPAGWVPGSGPEHPGTRRAARFHSGPPRPRNVTALGCGSPRTAAIWPGCACMASHSLISILRPIVAPALPGARWARSDSPEPSVLRLNRLKPRPGTSMQKPYLLFRRHTGE